MKNCKLKYPFVIVLLILSMISSVFAGNPFLPMISKPYAEYEKEMKRIHYELDYMEQEEADSLMIYMDEAVKKANNSHWQLEAEILYITYKFRANTRGESSNSYTIENAIKDYQSVYNKAQKENNDIIRIRALRAIMNCYYVFKKDFDSAFEIAKTLDKELNNISSAELSEKIYVYCEIAEMHFRFGDYQEAELFYNKIIEDKQTHHLSSYPSACNGLGLIYRIYYNDIEKSDEYFKQILNVQFSDYLNQKENLEWIGIAKGNLGINLFLKKRYEEAIPLLEFAKKQLLEINDYSFAFKMSVTLAEIYLEQNKLNKAKEYIDLSAEYANKIYLNKPNSKLYPILAKYYSVVGNNILAMMYKDSALIAQREEFEEYNALKLLYAEQRLWRLEMEIQEDELLAEHARAEHYKKLILSIGLGLFFIICLLLLVLINYRKKNHAYRMLIQKNKELANSHTPNTLTQDSQTQKIKPTDEEMAFMELIRKTITEEKLYVNQDFDLNDLTNRLNTNRTYLSAIVNHCTGKSFTNLVNEYRVNEAIHILSVKTRTIPTMDEVAFRSGFNDRKTLSRVFKKTTGLTPTEFRAKINKKTPN